MSGPRPASANGLSAGEPPTLPDVGFHSASPSPATMPTGQCVTSKTRRRTHPLRRALQRAQHDLQADAAARARSGRHAGESDTTSWRRPPEHERGRRRRRAHEIGERACRRSLWYRRTTIGGRAARLLGQQRHLDGGVGIDQRVLQQHTRHAVRERGIHRQLLRQLDAARDGADRRPQRAASRARRSAGPARRSCGSARWRRSFRARGRTDRTGRGNRCRPTAPRAPRPAPARSSPGRRAPRPSGGPGSGRHSSTVSTSSPRGTTGSVRRQRRVHGEEPRVGQQARPLCAPAMSSRRSWSSSRPRARRCRRCSRRGWC